MFSNFMGPIHELNKVYKTFAWTERADMAFQKIKKRLFSLPVISFPDFSRLFTPTNDASDVVCGVILMQEADNRKKSHPAEQNWSTTEQETCYKMGDIEIRLFLT